MKTDRKIIALDIGGVCISLHFDKCFNVLGIENDPVKKSLFLELCRELGNGNISEKSWMERAFCIFDQRISADDIRLAWEMVLGAEIPGMPEFAEKLIKKNYEFVFLSDTSTIHMSKFRRFSKLWPMSSGAVFSYEVGRHKPDNAMYEVFESRFGVPLLYADDMIENVKAARQRGWNAIVFNDPTDLIKLLNMEFEQ